MPSDLEERILNERAQLLSLDSALDDKRTPYLSEIAAKETKPAATTTAQ